MSTVRSLATRAVFYTLRMVKSLDDLSGHRYQVLFRVLDDVNQSIKEELGKRRDLPMTKWVLPYSKVDREMVDWVGGKNANLGELLNKVELPIPEGFAVTTRAYDFFLDRNDLIDEINRMRRDIDPTDPRAVTKVSRDIQMLIQSASVPSELQDAILSAYDSMEQNIRESDGNSRGRIRVAVRSSAIGEDSELSFAGQYRSALNVTSDKIIETYKYVLAGLYTSRAVAYRLSKGIRDEDIAMSVACIQMVDSVASGVMYSRHPYNLMEDTILISAVWGLGPYAVEGIITPDTYVVSKEQQPKIVQSIVSHKPVQLVADPAGGVRETAVDPDRQNLPCLSPEQILTLAGFALRLERHYQCPQDTEWALDQSGSLLVLQTRPLHLESLQKVGPKAVPKLEGYGLILEGATVAHPGVGCGPAFHVRSEEDLENFPEGAVLVAKHSSPEYVLVMQKAQGIVTDVGSVTGHMASLAREFGVPTLLNARSATAAIPAGSEITVDAFSGRVYAGRVPELISMQCIRESPMKDTPVYQTLRRVADHVVPLHLINPDAANFAPEFCRTLHDIMRLVHELSYQEMFRISDAVSDAEGGGSVRLKAPIPLDLRIIDLGGGLDGVSERTRWVTEDQVLSVPLKALLKGMLHEDVQSRRPRPIELGGFLSVMREQMLSPNNIPDRFGDRSYAILSDKYLNFSSRIGYHYSVLDCYCGETVNKNYITFSFKGGAADEIRRNRRARAIGAIFEALDFKVEVREDRIDARLMKYERGVIEAKLDMVGRVLQYTRQMDMLMKSEASVEALAKCFLEGNYHLDDDSFGKMESNAAE
jgi:pyruvate,water dikinase